MSKIDVEDMTLARWIILVGQNGISLLEKGRNDRFDVIVDYRWGPMNATALIHKMMSYVPTAEVCDVVLDDHVTRVSYSDPGVILSSSSVTQDFGRVAVHFFDILKHRACRLESERSDLEELVDAFSPFFIRIRRFVLRSPTQDFRYIVSVDTSVVIKKPYAWFGEIKTALSTVLISRPTAGVSMNDRDAAQWVETPMQVPAPVRPVAAPVRPVAAPVSPVAAAPLPKDITAPQSSPIAAEIVPPRPIPVSVPVSVPVADPPTSSRASKGKLTFIFSASDDPVIALLAAGVVWTLPKQKDQAGPITVTEIGVYRKKLSSPFRKLIGVTAHQETETLPMPTDKLDRLIQNIAAYADLPGDHVLFFGYEMLSTDLLIHISRFLQDAAVRYQIIVCNDSAARTPQLMGFETVFDGLARKSWIYLEGPDVRRAPLRTHLPHWKTYKTPRLDDAILKKIMEGEFRVVEKLRLSKTNLSNAQSSTYAQWLSEFGAAIADS
jgi:hypothetical protein